jgi:hypothetical protein
MPYPANARSRSSPADSLAINASMTVNQSEFAALARTQCNCRQARLKPGHDCNSELTPAIPEPIRTSTPPKCLDPNVRHPTPSLCPLRFDQFGMASPTAAFELTRSHHFSIDVEFQHLTSDCFSPSTRSRRNFKFRACQTVDHLDRAQRSCAS